MSKKVSSLMVVAWLGLAGAAPAEARTRPAARVALPAKATHAPVTARKAAPNTTVYERVQHMRFIDDVVEAGLQRPDGVVVSGTRLAPRSSLIRVRANFVPELIKSAEDL